MEYLALQKDLIEVAYTSTCRDTLTKQEWKGNLAFIGADVTTTAHCPEKDQKFGQIYVL